MTEQEYRDKLELEEKQIKTQQDLSNYIQRIVDNGSHEYGTIVIGMGQAMIATFKYMNAAPSGGITGMQASFLGWEMIKEFFTLKNGRLIDYNDMLYPQYEHKFRTIDKSQWNTLQAQAKENLEKRGHAVPRIVEHWQSVVDGTIPFGYQLRDS